MLIGCVGPAIEKTRIPTEEVPRIARETGLQHVWRGRSLDALTAVYGAPRLVMDVPGRRALDTSVVVYGVQDEVSDCIDAFTIVAVNGRRIVADYFCR